MVKLTIQQDVLPLQGKGDLIIATDNSGAIGEKELDELIVSYEEVAYYLFRVTFMDMLAAGAWPKSLILQNFNGDEAWSPLLKGLQQGMAEAKIAQLPITGSSESNFDLKQSATSVTMIGQEVKKEDLTWKDALKKEYNLAVIGKPLVGAEVLQNPDEIASLENFSWLSQREEILALIPIGSKGIRAELKKVEENLSVNLPKILDLEKSAGPSTCYIVIYQKDFEEKLGESITDPIFKGSW